MFKRFSKGTTYLFDTLVIAGAEASTHIFSDIAYNPPVSIPQTSIHTTISGYSTKLRKIFCHMYLGEAMVSLRTAEH